MNRNFKMTAIAMCVSSVMVLQGCGGSTVNKPPTTGSGSGSGGVVGTGSGSGAGGGSGTGTHTPTRECLNFCVQGR